MKAGIHPDYKKVKITDTIDIDLIGEIVNETKSSK